MYSNQSIFILCFDEQAFHVNPFGKIQQSANNDRAALGSELKFAAKRHCEIFDRRSRPIAAIHCISALAIHLICRLLFLVGQLISS